MSLAAGSVQVFILAENRLLREALSRILNKKSDISVVGASAFSANVVEQIGAAGADVLLSDSAAVALSELRLVPEVRVAIPGLKVVMVGMDPDKETFLRAVRDGVVGYVLKDASALEVAAAVRSVANNEAVCPPSLNLILFEYFSKQALRSQSSAFVMRHDLGLTRREQQLVQMINTGLTNKEIASQLNIAEQTVKNHIHRMLRKLGATSRLGAVEVCRTRLAVT
jgi:DNA-binding NarL/FixJ family response regulator